MLEPAIKYKEQLEKLFYDIWFKDKYKYWNHAMYYEKHVIEENTWSKHQFVSVHDGKVIGYIGYNVSRASNDVNAFNIINFSDNKITFGKDLYQALKDIFETYKFRKLNFSVLVGNPIEKSYDKMIEKYGGRIVGTYKKDIKLIDGEYYDRKTYEIFADDYFNTINSKEVNPMEQFTLIIYKEDHLKPYQYTEEIQAKDFSEALCIGNKRICEIGGRFKTPFDWEVVSCRR